ncbi:hypothetical protein [Nonomuraea jabiensis]|uniref:hypothetical protein n=1 Tax=Nonomuraea jabiensis TaxID=882448 RepID=UPI003D72111D
MTDALRGHRPSPTEPSLYSPPELRTELPHEPLIESMHPYVDDTNDKIAVPAGARLTKKQERYLTGVWPPLDDAEDVQLQLIRSAGAAPIRQTTLVLHLTAAKPSVTITSIRPVDIHRGTALAGTLLDINLPILPGEKDVPRDLWQDSVDMIFDFEQAQPIALHPHGPNRYSPLPAYFPGTQLRIDDASPDDERMLVIRSVLYDGRSSVTFKFDVEYRAGDAVHHLIVDDGGRPFRLTGIHCVREGFASYQRARTALAVETKPTLVSNPHSLGYSDCLPPHLRCMVCGQNRTGKG